jgi:hypothetical protein
MAAGRFEEQRGMMGGRQNFTTGNKNGSKQN